MQAVTAGGGREPVGGTVGEDLAPGQYLSGERPPQFLSVSLTGRDDAPRWKEVVEPLPIGRPMHHLEFDSECAVDADADAVRWLVEARNEAG